MSTDEEKRWIHEFSKGNQESFIRIYKRYWKELFLTAHSVTFSKEIAEDIVQDIFVTLWEKREQMSHIQSLKAYLKTATRNSCLQYIERHINRYKFIVPLADVMESVLSDNNLNTHIYMQEIEQCVSKSIDQMSPKMRKVFEMSRNDLKTHKDIAKELNISVETVKKHVQHALAIIKNNLEGLDSLSKTLLIFYFLNK